MKKIQFLLLFSLILFSCNKDIQLVDCKDNFDCRRLATCYRYEFATPDEYKDIIDKEGLVYNNKINSPIVKKQNIELLENTKTLFLINNSKTKVYQVRIQITDEKNKVSYKDYEIQPTQQICLGCDSMIEVDLKESKKIIEQIYYDSYIGSQDRSYTITTYQYEGKIKKIYNLNFQIHNTKVISEY